MTGTDRAADSSTRSSSSNTSNLSASSATDPRCNSGRDRARVRHSLTLFSALSGSSVKSSFRRGLPVRGRRHAGSAACRSKSIRSVGDDEFDLELQVESSLPALCVAHTSNADFPCSGSGLCKTEMVFVAASEAAPPRPASAAGGCVRAEGSITAELIAGWTVADEVTAAGEEVLCGVCGLHTGAEFEFGGDTTGATSISARLPRASLTPKTTSSPVSLRR